MKSVPIFAAAIMIAFPSVGPAEAAEIQIAAQNPVVELTISEQIASTPDTATFSTGVSTLAPTATAALRQNSEKVRTLMAKIKALGIDEKDVQTSGINLNAEYEWVQATRSNKFNGYRVSNQVNVKVRDISQLGTILDGVVSAGATDLNGPNFSLEKDDEIKASARVKALKRGRDQAMVYARESGYSGVRILAISESIVGRSPGPMPVMRMEAADASANAAPVAPGQVDTTVLVSLQFEMTN